MIAGVDVVIHNFRPGVMDKLNLDSEALRAINPKLVYIAISGFGTEGRCRMCQRMTPSFRHAGWPPHRVEAMSLRLCARCSATRLPNRLSGGDSGFICAGAIGRATAHRFVDDRLGLFFIFWMAFKSPCSMRIMSALLC